MDRSRTNSLMAAMVRSLVTEKPGLFVVAAPVNGDAIPAVAELAAKRGGPVLWFDMAMREGQFISNALHCAGVDPDHVAMFSLQPISTDPHANAGQITRLLSDFLPRCTPEMGGVTVVLTGLREGSDATHNTLTLVDQGCRAEGVLAVFVAPRRTDSTARVCSFKVYNDARL